MQVEIWMQVGFFLFFSSVLQSIAGFGFALALIPILMLLGFDVIPAISISLAGSTVQRLILVHHLSDHIDWKQILSMIPIGILGLLLGLFMLYLFSNLDKKMVRQIIGFIILSLIMMRHFFHIKPVDNIKRGWGYLASFFSGFLTGLANIGGPPLVLWILAHKWPQRKMRVFCPIFTLFLLPFQIISMSIMFGKVVPLTFISALILSPAVLIGSFLGLKIGNKLEEAKIRIIISTLLLVISLLAIIKPLFES